MSCEICVPESASKILSASRATWCECAFITKASPDCMDSTKFLIGNVRHWRTRLCLPIAQAIDNHSFSQSPLQVDNDLIPSRIAPSSTSPPATMISARSEPSGYFAFLYRHLGEIRIEFSKPFNLIRVSIGWTVC